MLVAGLWLALLGCSSDRVVCESPEQTLAEAGGEALTCGEAEPALDYIELLAARPISKQESMVLAGVRDRFEADPDEARAQLQRLESDRRFILGETGFDGTARRSEAAYALVKGGGPIDEQDGRLHRAATAAVAVWNTHDDDRLALTEADIEAWILYASLCRQVQGAGVLRISVADRVGVYGTMAERWKHGTRMERVAMGSLGPVWHNVKVRWDMASYDEQQAWAGAAPLPPPMTATSLGYLNAILEGDLLGHAASIHGKLGPLTMVR